MMLLKRIKSFGVSWNDIKGLFTDALWKGAEDISPAVAWQRLVHFIKIVRITLSTFAKNRMGFQCTALSYCMTLALIPFVAFVLFVSDGLKISSQLLEMLENIIPENAEFVYLILDKADNIIAALQSGPVGVVSTLTFLWTIIWLMYQVERVFNNVWGLQKSRRNMLRRVSSYIIALLLSPFVVLVFCYGVAFYTELPSLLGWNLDVYIQAVTKFLGWIIFWAITTGTFFAMYKFIPSVDVETRPALTAAIFAALVFVLFQNMYLYTQTFVTKLNNVYGMLAAVPLYLIWMSLSWQIIIYGAELCFGLQNVNTYRPPQWESDR